MSYRHSSYRRLSKAVKKAMTPSQDGPLTRAEMNRVLHWSNRPALPKPATWGRPCWAFEWLPDATSHVVADDSDDPEHVDDCPGCPVGAEADAS
ncbi:hypothetical protein [Streptomyces rochei]|uniref:hypothetical protein n=1 Tax=Streptomyces rochei TaxID=1928 RepID=UPI0036FC9217